MYLNSKLRKDYSKSDFPQLPEKKNKKESTDVQTLGNRREVFERYLNFFVSNNIINDNIRNFLKSNEEVPYFGKKSKKEERAEKRSMAQNSRRETEQSQRADLEESKEDSLRRNESSSSNKYEEVRVEETDEKALRGSNDLAFSIRAGMSQSVLTNPAYRVDIDRSVKKNGQIYYEIKVRDLSSTAVYTTSKRYSEIKLFHKMLKSEAQKHYSNCPPLPDKGKLSILASKDDPKVIQYRRVALASYFNYVLNHKVLANVEITREFLSITDQK
eukprot:TRINITY_DN11057_c0_g1_i4.p1 TRINITY_DN11057_c0_g1~~TRINITY_DN11057_c0_g1_i4.p1  ORF type:complete len:272 (-),score=72.88 TRINITY_DN11057_c0_g1_i4:538-1353(-)